LSESGVTPSNETLLAEYAAANTVYLTYDGYRWQAGTFLIAGVFVYWGFLISNSAPGSVIGAASILVSLLMSCWLLFAHHYRQLYVYKLLRIQEIEATLGMEQNRRFMPGAPSGIFHRAHGATGHVLDLTVYALTSLGGGALAWIKSGFSFWDIAVVPIVALVIALVLRNEGLLNQDIKNWRDARAA
jgi:hypothetical protein